LKLEWRNVEANLLTFTKSKDIFVILTNSQGDIVHQQYYLINHPFKEGDKLCNAFDKGEAWDCIIVDDKNRLKVTLVHGYPKIYIRQLPEEPGNAGLSRSYLMIGIAVAITLLILFLCGYYFIPYTKNIDGKDDSMRKKDF
jgi:hypothetical protein